MTPQEHIDNIFDVNSSWRESYNEIGCLLAFDYDCSLEGSIMVDVIMEEHNISEDDAIHEIILYAQCNNLVWDKDTIISNKEYVIETLTNYGGEGEKDYEYMMETK